jgi:chloride channel protein, CIC family
MSRSLESLDNRSNHELAGVVTRNQLVQLYEKEVDTASKIKLSEIATRNPEVAFPDEPLRAVVNRMAESGFTRFPVLGQDGDGKIVGIVSLNDLLHARTRNLEDERTRERVLRIRMPFGRHAEESQTKLTDGADFPEGSSSQDPEEHRIHG